MKRKLLSLRLALALLSACPAPEGTKWTVGGPIMTNVIAYPASVNAAETGKRLAGCVLASENETELAPSVFSKTDTLRLRLETPCITP